MVQYILICVKKGFTYICLYFEGRGRGVQTLRPATKVQNKKSTCFTEEGVEGVITTTNSLVTWHLSIRLDAMLEAEKLPARIANLDASLSEVKAEDLTHICKVG